MAKEPASWVGLGHWELRKVLEQRRGAATPMMSRIFWGRRGAGLEEKRRQHPRTRSAWNLGIF